MSDIAIRVVNLGKEYRIGKLQNTRVTFREALTSAFKSPFRKARSLIRGDAYAAGSLDESIWALKDVSFEVKRGEVVGIIGHNGAGKSTLLKVLSRITEPSKGYVDIFGRVGALLEVGTGFHLELTGRENVYLNGSILGMSRHEVAAKFDEIVDFAGVEKFIDTPVKHYSSGMRLRLGFAVAAYLEPEILIVDEVLAVGDAAFQQKCMGKMGEVASEGRTVLFVSHNMDAISSLTQRCIQLSDGQIVAEGEPDEIVTRYLNHVADKNRAGLVDLTPKDLQQRAFYLTQMQTLNREGQQQNVFMEREPIVVQMDFTVTRKLNALQLGCSINYQRFGRSIFSVPTELIKGLEPGDYSTTFEINPNFMRGGDYELHPKAFENGIRYQGNPNVLHLTVVADQSNVGDPFLQKWVAGPMRFDYQFGEVKKRQTVELPNPAGEIIRVP